jgi:hypothetical protein
MDSIITVHQQAGEINTPKRVTRKRPPERVAIPYEKSLISCKDYAIKYQSIRGERVL